MTRSMIQYDADYVILEVDQPLLESVFWRYASSVMELQGPFDFQDPNSENPVRSSLGNDLLQRFHSSEGPNGMMTARNRKGIVD
jgi:hypothetical protein